MRSAATGSASISPGDRGASRASCSSRLTHVVSAIASAFCASARVGAVCPRRLARTCVTGLSGDTGGPRVLGEPRFEPRSHRRAPIDRGPWWMSHSSTSHTATRTESGEAVGRAEGMSPGAARRISHEVRPRPGLMAPRPGEGEGAPPGPRVGSFYGAGRGVVSPFRAPFSVQPCPLMRPDTGGRCAPVGPDSPAADTREGARPGNDGTGPVHEFGGHAANPLARLARTYSRLHARSRSM